MLHASLRAAALASICALGCNAVSVSPTPVPTTDVPGGRVDAPVGERCAIGTVSMCTCNDGNRGRQLCGLDMVYGPCVCADAGSAVDASGVIEGGVSPTPDAGIASPPVTGPMCTSSGAVDLLVMVDNSNSMRDNQANLARNFRSFVTTLFAPASGGRVRSLHVGVVSSDLGTPGSIVPSCANSDVGDDGIMNPIRNGPAIRSHQPWTTAAPGVRPSRCRDNPDQYPNFLDFSAGGDLAAFSEDFVCNAYLSVGGCGLEQQIESAYRALVIRDARVRPGNMDPNAGFVREDSVLAVLMLTDEEDGSVRDCRYREPGDPDGACAAGDMSSGIEVFDSTSPSWSSADLNLRFYMYRPGSSQDPTWPLGRYVDPQRGNRGFLSLRPGRANHFVLGAITGVPLAFGGETVDWDAMLGRNPDGSDGYTGMSNEGPVSMRQRNADAVCGTRVVPACRREGSTYDPMACDTTRQYFAWPSRRVAQLVRRVNDVNGNGVLGSICANDYTPVLQRFAARIASRLCGS